MKFKYSYLILILLLFSSYIFAQITPNGKSVSSSDGYGDLGSEAISAINYMVDNYYDVDIIQSSQANHGRFNCHFYAWNNTQGYGVWSQDYLWKNGQPSPLKWINSPTDYYTDQNYSQPSGYASYVSTTSGDAEICVYTSGGTITHSARRLSYTSKLISKWGAWGIYKHDPYECPDGRWAWSPEWGWQQSADYGTITAYYKINPKYRPVGSGDPGGRNWGTISNALIDIPSGSVIKVGSGTFTENVSMSNKYNVDIIGQGYNSSYINGNVSITSSDYSDLSDLKTKNISTNNSWITINYVKGDKFTIYGDEVQINNSIFSSGQVPNQITNCDGTIYNCDITECLIGVYLLSNSLYNVGNNYFCQNDGDIYAYSGSTAFAMYNTYSYNPYQSCDGDVRISGTTDICGLNKLAKRNTENNLQNNGDEPSKQEFSVVDEQYASLLQEVNDEKVSTGTVDMKNYENDYDLVIDEYKAFLDKYPNSKEAPSAVFRTVHCYQQKDDYDGYYDFINVLLLDEKYDGIKPHVERHLVAYYVHEQAYKTAIETADKVISYSNQDENLYCELLYEKGLIYKYQLNEKEKAEEMFVTIVKEHPENKMVSYAEFQLEEMGYELEKELPGEQELANSEFTCEIYPNPFNPSTTISYTIPYVSNVEISIYDIMGREIKSFTTYQQAKGSHKVVWDGTNSSGNRVSSGIYFYRFEAALFNNNKQFVKSAILLLVK